MTLREKIRAMVKHIREKTDEEVDRIFKEAEEKAASIGKNYNEQAERLYNEIVEDAKAGANQYERREESRAELEAAKMIMEAKAEILESTIRELKARAEALIGTESYPELLMSFVGEAIETLEEKSVVIKAGKRELEILKSTLTKLQAENPGVEISLSKEALSEQDAVTGGVIVASADGRLRVENSIAGKIEENREWIARELFERLSGGR